MIIWCMGINFYCLASVHVFIGISAVTINVSKDKPVIGFDDVYKDLETKLLFEALSVYCIWMGGYYNHKANPLFLLMSSNIRWFPSFNVPSSWSDEVQSELDLVSVVSRMKSSIFSS